ncbi:hypothetical protein [Acinetobacter sp. YH1901136]|uniref:hypothetical protein n=1 Tax=Acinetobacter sp. YH1901136 TaxID=2601200 RepID=UPI0015D2D867|nr:hypothetical protein [Acinetobacter sp. YH1901136]
MSDDLERVATTTKALKTEALKPKPNKLLKFIAGFFITLIALYELAFLLVGAAYGTDVFAFILIYSVFMHITLLPFMLYGIGGFIILSLSDQNYRAVTQQAPKILFIGLLLCMVVIGISEWAHQMGILDSRFRLDWR